MPLLVRSAIGADAAGRVEVYRPYVLDTVITFETEVPTIEDMAARIGAGYAYAHRFNSRAAYQWSVETGVYMAQDRRRRELGRMLCAELLSRLARRGFRRAFAGIAQPNEASPAGQAVDAVRLATTSNNGTAHCGTNLRPRPAPD